MSRPTVRSKQRLLFCPCGTNSPAIAGLCRSCYTQAVHSRARFGGQRHFVLIRDGHACRIWVLGINGTENRVKDVRSVTVCASSDVLQRISWIPQGSEFASNHRIGD
jgi:hypothetical protein